MFLVNASPLVALQRKWEPFPQSGNCRYPVCFSESEEDLARTAVNAKVQMIINKLQSEEVAFGASSEYGCLMQKNQKGAKDRGRTFRSNDQVLQEHLKYTLRNCPADSDGMDMEENAELGPLSLNSDSDDSVDREIEEAIQEYLRNKGQSIPPLPGSTENLPSKGEGHPMQQKYPSCDVACHLCPAGCGPVSMTQQYVIPDRVGGHEVVRWAASPCSASSDDSFEQSIKAEIEQFLKKKKQQERKKVTRRTKQFHQREEFQEKVAVTQKGSINRGKRNSLKQGGKVYFLKEHPERQRVSTPKGLKSKASEEPAALKTERQTDVPAPGVCYSSFLEESEKSGKGQMPSSARREERVGCIDLSDSSSDDGIEEAIQRYQLEKVKRAAESTAGCVSLQKEELSASKAENISPSLTRAWPGIAQKAPSCSRKDTSTKPAVLNGPGATCNDLGKSRSRSPPEDSFAKGAVTFQASCRADTAAELMCAEAILDISKTILPPPAASENKLFTTGPFFSSRNMLPSQHESEDNAVDSDDSIEQEIRAFLAVKAKTEHLIAKSRDASQAFQRPPSLGPSFEQTQSSKQMFPKCLKLPLNHKKKLKRKSDIVAQNEDAQLIFSEVGYVDKNLSKSSLTQLKDKRTGMGVLYPKDTISSICLASPLSHALRDSRCLVENITEGQQKYGADDKSSSLDSDEDLDTAIKDLLRSRRKLKKKPKDQRVHYKKQVRFGDAEMHIFYKNERESQSQMPTLLKKCVVSSRRDIREGNVKKGPLRKPKGTVEFELECKKQCQTKPVPGAGIQDAPKAPPCLWTVTSWADDSSPIDSDDSIEQEIQRFLAEKAKAGVLPGAKGAAETLGADKPQAALSKAEWQLLRCGGHASEKAGRSMEHLDPLVAEPSSHLRCAGEMEGNASQPSEPVRSFMEDGGSQALVADPQTLEAKGMGLPVKGAAAQRKAIWAGRLDRRALSSGKGKAESCKWQHYFKAISSFKRKSSYEFKTSSKFLTCLKGGGNKKKSLLLGKRQGINLSLLEKHGDALATNSFGERSLLKEIVGSRSEAGVREADQGPGFQAGRLHPCIQEGKGRDQEITASNEVVSFAKRNPAEGLKVDSSQSLPVQEPGIEETRGVPASPGVTVPVGEGKIPEGSPSWGKGQVPEGPCGLSPKGKAVGPGGTAEEQSQKLLAGGSAEFTDGPVGECRTHTVS